MPTTRPRNTAPPPHALLKALSHPLRLSIIEHMVDKRGVSVSPSEVAVAIEKPLTHVSYHFRKLTELGIITCVRKRPKRGVVEHYYQFSNSDVRQAIILLRRAAKKTQAIPA